MDKGTKFFIGSLRAIGALCIIATIVCILVALAREIQLVIIAALFFIVSQTLYATARDTQKFESKNNQ